jgi:UDP-N-acetylmuramyl pentapeptide phosphotransferase/UDP-N-acetylglucosamine-1-phosphate transferase
MNLELIIALIVNNLLIGNCLAYLLIWSYNYDDESEPKKHKGTYIIAALGGVLFIITILFYGLYCETVEMMRQNKWRKGSN